MNGGIGVQFSGLLDRRILRRFDLYLVFSAFLDHSIDGVGYVLNLYRLRRWPGRWV